MLSEEGMRLPRPKQWRGTRTFIPDSRKLVSLSGVTPLINQSSPHGFAPTR